MSEPDKPDPRAQALRSPLAQASAETIAFAMMAFAAAGLLVVGQRRDIAREMAQDWLRQQGIESSFEIESIDANAFAGRMRVGSAKNPVFEAERVEVAYDLTAPWAGGPLGVSARAIRVVRPRLRVSYDGKKFSAGALDPLISDFLSRPKTDEPGPAVLIEDSLTTITTRNGAVRVTGDAALDDGKLLRFDGRLLPTRLTGKDFAIATSGGSLRLRKVGEALDTDFRIAVDDLTTANADLDGAQAALAGTIPYPNPQAQAVAGQANLKLAVRADRAAFGEAVASGFAGSTRLTGAVGGSLSNLNFSGRGAGLASMAALDAEGLEARRLSADFTLPLLALQRNAEGLKTTSTVSFRTRAASATAREITVTGADARARGRFSAGKDGYFIHAVGEASGDSGLPAVRARRIAAAVPVLSSDPAQRQAMESALQDFRARASGVNLEVRNGEVTLALGGPVTLAAASGGQAVLTPHGRFGLVGARPGGFDIAMRGGGLPELSAKVASWSYRGGDIDARLALKGSLDAPPAQNAVIDAEGLLRVRGGRTTFELARCGRASAELIDFGDIDVTNASARVCAAGGPLVVASGGTWQVAGRFEDAEGDIPVWSAAAADGSGRFDVGGSGDMDRAAIQVAAMRVTDTMAETRFNPVRARGHANLGRGLWRASFPFATDSDRPVGTFTLEHHVASGRGGADIDATGLVFAEEGLQPAELAPLGQVIRSAVGPAAFTGRLDWGDGTFTSSGDLAVNGLNFRSPAGQVTGLRSNMSFVSLVPLVTALNQTLTIDTLAAITPLTNIASTFDLAEDSVTLRTTTAEVGEGRADLETVTIPLAAKPSFEGVLNLHRLSVGALIENTSLADRIQVDAILDGRVPFRLSPEGLRFTQGHLEAVQPGRISISRTVLSNVSTEGGEAAHPMDATTPEEPFNAVQDFAYQAMENLSFDELEATVNSLAEGRLGVLFRIKGYHDPKVAEEARISIFDALRGDALKQRVPLPKGTPVNLTLDTSLNFDELLAAWQRGWVDAAE
ncbi:MAG TPA: YdbH domain-containing protein [Caulobacteraceae bacterium]|nr:YdbH domain-containing protein [Caulobacteraceae bacterium]